jgi:hypothetical protein
MSRRTRAGSHTSAPTAAAPRTPPQVRFSERAALGDPLSVVRFLRGMAPAKLAQMQAALLEARPHFLWHLDPERPSAVDQILHDMCDA